MNNTNTIPNEELLKKVSGGVSASQYMVCSFVCPFCGKTHTFNLEWFVYTVKDEDLPVCSYNISYITVDFVPGSDGTVNVSAYPAGKGCQVRSADLHIDGAMRDGEFISFS